LSLPVSPSAVPGSPPAGLTAPAPSAATSPGRRSWAACSRSLAAWDGLIERWIGTERRRVNRGYAGYDDWQEEELRRSSPLADVSVGEILEQAIGVEPGHWSRADQMRVAAWLKANGWRRYQARGDVGREWRYRR